MWKCPECTAVLTYLKYSVRTTSSDYGSASLVDAPVLRENGTIDAREIVEAHETDDSGDTEWDETPTYTCPECQEEVYVESLIWEDDSAKGTKEETKKPEEPEETKHDIVTNKLILKRKEQNGMTDFAMVCRNMSCRRPFVFSPEGVKVWELNEREDKERFVDCPSCGSKNDLLSFFLAVSNKKLTRFRQLKKRVSRKLAP